MSHGTDYQRYKHKLERLQCKVKRSENARKELEIRLQRLMKERNECEKTASIHKTKYNTLLKHERKRLNRNEELLQMLEDVQTKAANLASNTERLKMLKNQQERTLINSWRRNACLQQQLFHPNAVQYVLPPPAPLASVSSMTSTQPAVDYQTSAINGKPSCFVDNPDAIYRNPLEEHTPSIKSFISTPNVVAHQQHPSISQQQQQQQQQLKLSSSLMPIYHSEPFHPLYNNFYIRSHEPQQSSFQEIAFTPNRNINKDMTKLHNIEHDQFVHDKKSNSMTPSVDQRPIYNSQFPWLLNKSKQPLDHHPYYSQIEPLNRTINQYSFDNGSTNSQINETRTPMNATSHDQQQRRQQQQQHGENKSNTDPSIYSGGREMILNANDIDSTNRYERNINDKCNEPLKGNTNNNVYANDNEYKPTHIESIDLRKSISSTTVAPTSNVTPSSTTMTARAADFTLNGNAQHIPYSAGTSTFDDLSNQRGHYPYEGGSERTYSSAHSKDAHINDGGGKVAADSIGSHTLLPIENKQKITNRRSSIDADSFAKTLGHDTEKESIAANIRRRYSVAANFLNLASNAENQTNSFNFTPTVSTNEYQKNTRAWVDNNNTSTSRGHTIEPEEHHIDSNRMHGQGDQSSLDNMNAMSRIDNTSNESRNGSAVIARSQIDLPVTLASSHTSPVDSNDAYLKQPNTEASYQDEQNVNQYDNGATPYATATYAMDDQTYVENAMEQLKLDENGGQRTAEDIIPVQFDDSVDRIRASGKTVTWADDPESNYKKQATANMYEAQQSMPNTEISADQYYASQPDAQQQQQIQQHDYPTSDDNGPVAGANESPHYQYDNSNQYDDGQYQYHTHQPDAVSADDGYYYGTEQVNQYDQYVAQPQQQEGTQQMQYYTAEPTEINDGTANDGYQQYQTEPALQVPPKQDEYYTVSPGENYYTDYDDQTYAASSNTTNVTGVAAQQKENQSHNQPQQQQQPQPQLQPQPLSNIPNQHEPIHVPNYLQSDTDDSQTGYPNQATNAAPQSQDSDFDFSTNS